jgi:hypothetical protein
VFSTLVGGWAGDRSGIQESLLICGMILIGSVCIAALFPAVRASGIERVEPATGED